MSSDPRNQIPETEQLLDVRKGFIIAASVCALLIVLVACRYWFNILVIDLCILRDLDSARQQFQDFLDCLFPWRKRRRRTDDDAARRQQGQDEDEETGVEVELGTTLFGGLLSGMSDSEREVVLESILRSKTITEDDLAQWTETHHRPLANSPELQEDRREGSRDEPLDGNAMMCSICLHDLQLGEEVVSVRSCEHIFHRECIIQWIESKGACPYCRTEILLPSKEDVVAVSTW